MFLVTRIFFKNHNLSHQWYFTRFHTFQIIYVSDILSYQNILLLLDEFVPNRDYPCKMWPSKHKIVITIQLAWSSRLYKHWIGRLSGLCFSRTMHSRNGPPSMLGYLVCLTSTSTLQGHTGTIMLLTYQFDLAWRWPFINVSKVLLRAIGDPTTRDRHYSDHPSHYVSPRPGIEPGLTACEASMLPTTPPGGDMNHNKWSSMTHSKQKALTISDLYTVSRMNLGKEKLLKAFGQLGEVLMQFILWAGHGFTHIDVLFDRYNTLSIESGTH